MLLHVLVLWALQSGLLHRAADVLVPVQLVAEFVAPPAPAVQPPQPTPNKAPVTHAKAAPHLPPMPLPFPIADAAPLQAAPELTAPMPAAALAPAAPPAQPHLELPSSKADYLQNPKPVYPGMSKRLGEQGQVIHSVLIGVDGLPISAQLVQSSGFDRLDQAAYAAVMRWRYVPGKRNGVPTAMSFNVPIVWQLQ